MRNATALSLLFFFFLILLLLLSVAVKAQNGVVSQRELWCVAKNNAGDGALQLAIDWACGPGGAYCGPIQVGGPCYDAKDIQNTASWAFNDYYLQHGLTDDACYFSNTAALTSLNPSHGSCKFPSSLSVNNGSISNSTTPTIEMAPDGDDLSSATQFSGVSCWPLLVIGFYVYQVLTDSL